MKKTISKKNKAKGLNYIFPTISVSIIFATTSVAQAATYFNDDIESGVVGSSPTYRDSVSNAGWGGQTNVHVVDNSLSSVTPHSGSKMLRFEFSYPGAGHMAESRFNLGSQQTGDVYLRFYIYYPDGTEVGENRYEHRGNTNFGNNKVFRIWGDDYNDTIKVGASVRAADDPNIEWFYAEARSTAYHVTGCGPSMASAYHADGSALNRHTWGPADLGRWISYEFHVRPDDGSGNGAIEFWIDGVFIFGDTAMVFDEAPCAPGYFQNGYLLGSANSGFDNATNIYIDDIVFSDTYIGPTGTDSVAPLLAEVRAVTTPTTNPTPSYVFSSNEAGIITYGGDCSSATTLAVIGNNSVAFNTLADGTHNNCTITVTDNSNNASTPLSVSTFTIISSSIRADVDQSGTVDTTDAFLTLRNSLGLTMSGTNWHASSTTGDVDCNSFTNSTDASLILRDSLGLEMDGTGWCVS